MKRVLAFDIYGTLIDTQGVVTLLVDILGDEKAMLFSETWRLKQLEYSYRRGLMKQYKKFSICTEEALIRGPKSNLQKMYAKLINYLYFINS